MVSFLVVLLIIYFSPIYSNWAKFVFRGLGLSFGVVLTIKSS